METQTSEQLKAIVKEKYAQIAEANNTEIGCCDGPGCCSSTASMADDYTQLEGYVSDADLGLGCGLPTAFAGIKEGDTVVDLGSGAGNDAFIARSITGSRGNVIGIDFTDAMIRKARENAAKLQYENVHFLPGDIEHLPLANDVADVVVSNCVLNLVPDKAQAFAEMFRVLKDGAHFCVSDIVIEGTLPDKLKSLAEMYAGCVSGAVQKETYLNVVRDSGFTDITIQKEKEIFLPDELLSRHLTPQEIESFRGTGNRILSITMTATKPGKSSSCCGPECCSA